MTTPYLRNYYAGGGTSTTLANAMGSADGSFAITADTGWPGGAGFFTVVIDRGTSSEEKIRCASNSGTTVTVASDGNGGRGYDGTSATGHNSGATVSLCGTAVDFDQANQVVTQVLGQTDAAKGDILTMLSAAGPNTLTRVGIGMAGQLLGISAGLPAWQTVASGPVSDTTSSATVVNADGFAGPTSGTMPAVTVTTLTTALVTIVASWANSNNSDAQGIGFAVSGATTIAASLANAAYASVALDAIATMQKTVLLTGLTAGSNIFTFKGYTNGSSTETFSNMSIIVQALAS